MIMLPISYVVVSVVIGAALATEQLVTAMEREDWYTDAVLSPFVWFAMSIGWPVVVSARIVRCIKNDRIRD